MRIAIVTSRGCVYPSAKFPQYMDQDNCFCNLATEGQVHLIGNILQRRVYAISQLSFSSWKNQPLAWNNRYTATLSLVPPVAKLRDLLDKFSDAMYTRSFLPYLSGRNVDIIYSFPWPFDRYVGQWAKKLGKPLIIEMWEDYACFTALAMEALGIRRTIIKREEDRIYRWMRDISAMADRVIIPTEVFAARLESLGINRNKIQVVPVCMKSSPPPDPSPLLLREQYNIKDDEKIVFYIGAASSRHDLSTLLRSIPYIKSKLFFIIAGGRSKKLEQQAALVSSAKVRTVFTGRLEQDKLEEYLALSDMCVAPYRFYKPSGFFPGKIVRYMLSGKAIVATDLPEIREMFQGQDAGILVPQGNSKAIAQAIDALAEDDQKRVVMGEIAKKIAINNYLIRHHTEKLIRVFREVLSQQGNQLRQLTKNNQ